MAGNIQTYEAPQNLGLNPTETGIDATVNAAKRVGMFYNQKADALNQEGGEIKSAVADVGQVAVNFMDHREISAGAATFAKMQDGLTQQWNEIAKNADPNDPSVAAKFRETVVEPALSQFQSGFNTDNSQKFAEQKIESLRQHMFEKSAADMSTLAGIAVRKNINDSTTAMSNTAITDPSSVPELLKGVDHSISAVVGSSPTLSPADAARATGELSDATKTAIIKAGAIGAIQKSANPEETAAEWIKKYPDRISGSEIQTLGAFARQQIRAQHADENYQRLNKQRADEDASDVREGQYISKLHSDDPKEAATVTARAIANDFTLSRPARERMIGIVERETKPEAAAKVSNGTAIDLISRIRAPSGDPTRIDSLDAVYDAYEKGNLSKADLKFVRDEFVNLRTPEGAALGSQQEEFIKSVKPLIDKSNPLLGKIDQSGPQQVYNFTMDLRRKVDEYRKAGKDPRALMDPSKPDYMGSPAALLGYQKPLQQSLQDTAARLRGGGGLPAADTITGVKNEPAPVATSTPRPAAPKPPEKGFIKDGYEFLGGNPGEAASWRKAGT